MRPLRSMLTGDAGMKVSFLDKVARIRLAALAPRR